MNPLQTEIDTYNKQLSTLIGQAGKFVLIKGTEIVDVYDSYEDALKAGYQKFELQPFLVKKIAPTEQIAFFTRSFVTACPASI